MHAIPGPMDGVPTLEILGAPCRDVRFRRVPFPVILDEGIRINHTDVAAAVHEKVQEVDARGFPEVLDTVTDDDEIKPDPRRDQDIKRVPHDHLVIDGFKAELFDIRGIDLDGGRMRNELVIHHALPDEIAVLTGSWPNVEDSRGTKQFDKAADVVVECCGRVWHWNFIYPTRFPLVKFWSYS